MHCMSIPRPPPPGSGTAKRVAGAAALAVLMLGSPLFVATCAACGVTIHNEVAYRASQLLAIPSSPLPFSSLLSSDTPLVINSDSAPYPGVTSTTHRQDVFSSSGRKDAYSIPSLSNRPLNLFREIILEKKEFLLAGSFFPDWGYNCVGKLWNNAAEEAHWPPFIEAAINHIVETYPQPWADDHVKNLIVFLFGIVSHDTADVLWHSLEGLSEGFVAALAKISFEGDYHKAHTLADIGAEFVLSHMSKLNHLATTWKVPIRDLTQIYQRLDYRVPGPILSHCIRNGYALAQANSRLGSKLFPVYASKSPFLVEQMEEYPLGGLRDMTAWTVDCWQGLARHLNESIAAAAAARDDSSREYWPPQKSKIPFKLCNVFHDLETKDGLAHNMQHREQRPHRLHRLHSGHWHHHLPPVSTAITLLHEHGYNVLTDEDESTGVVSFTVERTIESSMQKEEAAEYIQDQDDTSSKDSFEDQEHTDSIPYPTEQPQHSRAATCTSLSDDIGSLTQVLYLPLPYSSFGHAVTTGDFNNDGKPEIVIGAPHATFDSHIPSQGAVYIVPAAKVLEHLGNNSRQNLNPLSSSLPALDVRTVASTFIVGNQSEAQSRFGWSLATVDLNGDGIDDLAIGAPSEGSQTLEYSGAIYVFFGRKVVGLQEVRLENADLVLRHNVHQPSQDSDYSMKTTTISRWRSDGKRVRLGPRRQPRQADPMVGLGTRLRGIDLTGDGFKDLVVLSPQAAVFVKKDVPHLASHNRPKRSFVHLPQAGKLSVFLASSRHTGHLTVGTDRDWELSGTTAYGWFGSSVAVLRDTAKERTVIAVGSPAFGSADHGEDSVMVGQVQGFVLPTATTTASNTKRKGQNQAATQATEPEIIFTIQGNRKFQQFGSRLEALSVSLPSSFSSSSSSAVPKSPYRHQELQSFLIAGSQSEEIKGVLPRVGKLWQAGVVRVLNLSMIPDGTKTTIGELENQQDRQQEEKSQAAVVVATLEGSQSLAHLSAAMAVSLNLGSQAGDTFGIWLTEPLARSEAGRVLKWEPELGEDRSRRQDHGDDDDDDGDEPELPPPDSVSECYFGSEFRGRFGSVVVVEDLNRDGTDDLIVASPHSSTFATLAGTVSIRLRL